MPDYDITRKSRPVVVIPYQPKWVSDFTQIAVRIRDVVNTAAIRIDHIGSTAVPGLAAKDVIDIQITVADLGRADTLTRSLIVVGFRQGITLAKIAQRAKNVQVRFKPLLVMLFS